MSLENFDDTIYERGPDEVWGELSRVSGFRGIGHVAISGHDGQGGDIIITAVALPDADDEQLPN